MARRSSVTAWPRARCAFDGVDEEGVAVDRVRHGQRPRRRAVPRAFRGGRSRPPKDIRVRLAAADRITDADAAAATAGRRVDRRRLLRNRRTHRRRCDRRDRPAGSGASRCSTRGRRRRSPDGWIIAVRRRSRRPARSRMGVATMRFDPLLAGPRTDRLGVAAVIGAWVVVRQRPRDRSALARWSAMGVLLVIVAADPALGGRQAAVSLRRQRPVRRRHHRQHGGQDYNAGEPRLDGVRRHRRRLPTSFPAPVLAGDVQLEDQGDRPLDDRRGRSTRRCNCSVRWTLYARGPDSTSPIDDAPGAPRARARWRLRRGLLPCPMASRPCSRRRPTSFEPVGDIVAGGAVLGYGTRDGAGCVYIGYDESPRAVHPRP